MRQRFVLRRCTPLVLSAVLAVAPAARAEPASERRADLLFQEGKALMEQGAIADACAKLAQSLSLVPRSGTRLNLAMCRHKEGRHATALRLYQAALEDARADGRPDREELVRRELAALRPLLSWLVVRLRPGAAAPGLVVRCDGAAIDEGAWGAPVPMDPGAHAVVAEAPGREPFEVVVTIESPGDRASVDIPSLPPAKLARPDAPAPAARPSRAMRVAGAATLGVGVGALAAGAMMGIKALRDSAQSRRLCPNDVCDGGAGFGVNQSARTAARLADVLLPIGAAAAGTGVFLLVYRPKDAGARASGALRVSPTGVSVEGSW